MPAVSRHLTWLLVSTQLGKRRLQPLPSGGARPPELGADTLRANLLALAAPDMEGRRTATPGGRRARAFVEQRFGAIGLEPLDDHGERPFAFEHRASRPCIDATARFA
jgi:hypothetical protein